MDTRIVRYLGIAEEAEYGTAETTIVKTLDPISCSLDPAGDQAVIWPGASRVNRLQKAGNYHIEGDAVVAADLVASMLFWKVLLGGYDFTEGAEAGDPNTHEFFLDPKPLMDSFTAFVGKDEFEHRFAGCVVSSMTLEFQDGALALNLSLLGASDEKENLSTPTFDEDEIFARHEVSLTIADSAATVPNVEDFTLNIDMNADVEAGIALDSRHPQRAWRGDPELGLTATLAFVDEDELQRFWGGTTETQPQDALSEFQMDFSIGANFDISLPRGVYVSASQPVDGRDRIEQEVEFTPLYDQDNSDEIILVTMVNDEGDMDA